MPVLEVGQRFGRQRPAVEEGHHAEIAAEALQADARLKRELGQPSSADRVAVDVLGSKPLITVATDRPAAARIEAPRRGDVIDSCAKDRAKAHPASKDDIVRYGVISGR